MAYAAGTKIRLIKEPARGHRDIGEIFIAAEPLKGRRCGDDPQFYIGRDGDTTWCPASYWELVGPVVTETVIKTRIVPGTYSGVHVGDSDNESVIVSFGGLGMVFQQQAYNADQLDAAAAVLSALAKGLRDA